ncbi:MAG: molybdenum cofactor guanylyltransferase [Pyrinomonadaceae bacterium]
MFDAYILAGGNSSRMGREKALLEINKTPMTSIVAEAVREAGADSLKIVAGTKAASLSRFFSDSPVIDDFSPNLGPPGGIFTALEDAKQDSVFAVACDLPFVSAELISFLKSRFDETNADALIPIQPDGFKQTLCAFYRKSKCIVPFQAHLLRSDVTPSVRDMLERVEAVYVGFEEFEHLAGAHDFFLNLNTPMDVESAREMSRPK